MQNNTQQIKEAIYGIVARIPPGKVTSYGRVAKLIPGCSARYVARTMKELPTDSKLPWFRVVTANLKIADFSGAERQVQLLNNEQVFLNQYRKIDLYHLWNSEGLTLSAE